MRESRLAAALDHPNIIPIYDAGEADGVLYIAMRYVDGADLKHAAQARRAARRRDASLAIVDQVGGALDAAHARGPRPPRRQAGEHPGRGDAEASTSTSTSSDFGIAKQTAAAAGSRGPGSSSARSTTPRPSRSRARSSTAAPTSTRSAACSTSASRRAPAYDKDSEVAMMYAHLLEPPPKVTDKRPDLPAEDRRHDRQGCAKSKDDRYASRPSSRPAFKQALASDGELGHGAAPDRARETVLAGRPPEPAATAVGPAPRTAPPAARRRKPERTGGGSRRSWLIAAAVVALIGLAILAGRAPARRQRLEVCEQRDFDPATTTGGAGAGAGAASDTLLAVLVPTQIAKLCKQAADPSTGRARDR